MTVGAVSKVQILNPLKFALICNTDPECPEYTDEVAVMTELLINIPKPEPQAPKPVARAPVHVKTDGLIDDELLKYVAGGEIFYG